MRTKVAVTLVLVLALAGGTAYAAKKVLHHYLIKSTSQIKPSVLSALKGDAGVTGPAGATGATGAPNPAATTVDGESVARLLFKAPANTGATNLFVGDGLALTATCSSSGNVGLTATSTDDEAELNVSGSGSTLFPILHPGFSSATVLSTTTSNQGSAIITYGRPSGQVVTVTLGFNDSDAFDGTSVCGIWGTAVASS